MLAFPEPLAGSAQSRAASRSCRCWWPAVIICGSDTSCQAGDPLGWSVWCCAPSSVHWQCYPEIAAKYPCWTMKRLASTPGCACGDCHAALLHQADQVSHSDFGMMLDRASNIQFSADPADRIHPTSHLHQGEREAMSHLQMRPPRMGPTFPVSLMTEYLHLTAVFQHGQQSEGTTVPGLDPCQRITAYCMKLQVPLPCHRPIAIQAFARRAYSQILQAPGAGLCSAAQQLALTSAVWALLQGRAVAGSVLQKLQRIFPGGNINQLVSSWYPSQALIALRASGTTRTCRDETRCSGNG